MIDVAILKSGRATDRLVAEALGWTDLEELEHSAPSSLGLFGIPPGRTARAIVPNYSGTTAALFALDDMQKKTGRPVQIDRYPESGS